jgi:3-methyladenine DNA glycosylase Tag
MRDFSEIFADAARLNGGKDTIDRKLAERPGWAPGRLARAGGDEILREMTRQIFYAGFYAKVIDSKWDGFEAAFHGFDPITCAAVSEERFDALLADDRIIRNGAKILSVQRNARFLLEIEAEGTSAGSFLDQWPSTDYGGLLDFLKAKGDRLGGFTGMFFCRAIGKPAYIVTHEVVTALVRESVVTKAPSGKREMAKVQQAFNDWSQESGLDLTSISRVLAMSAGPANTDRG